MKTQRAPQLKDHKTEILNLLMQYSGDRYVFNHKHDGSKQGYQLIRKDEVLDTSDIKDGVRIPVKDIGALVIKLTSEERLEIDFNAKAGYFWLKRNLDKVEDALYVDSARAVYGSGNFESTHVSYTDVEKLMQDSDTAMNLDLSYLSPQHKMNHDETQKARVLVQKYANFIREVLSGAEFISPSIGHYKLHKLPDKKKEKQTR
jgi:hypothetical protein